MTMQPGTEAAEQFGEFLKTRRTNRNLTQTEIAEALGTYGSTISLVESGKRVLKEELFNSWAKAYHMKPKSLRQAYFEALDLLPQAETTELVHSADVGLAFNQMFVECKNKGCTYYQQLRLISMPIVGSGLFVHANVTCQCGWMPTIKETATT